ALARRLGPEADQAHAPGGGGHREPIQQRLRLTIRLPRPANHALGEPRGRLRRLEELDERLVDPIATHAWPPSPSAARRRDLPRPTWLFTVLIEMRGMRASSAWPRPFT